MAHRKTTLGTYAHHIANILHTFRLGQCLLYRIQCGSDARCCIIHLMRNHTDHFLVCFLFSFHHFIGQSFHQIERMLEAAVHKWRVGAFIDTRVVQPDGAGCSIRNGGQFQGKRRIDFRQFPPLGFFRTDPHHLHRHGIELRYLFVQRHDNNSHGGSINHQVEKMILFSQAQPFVFQLFHHAIENIYHTVGLLLPHMA